MNITIKQATTEDAEFLAQMMLQNSRAGKKDGMFDLIFATNDNKTILGLLQKLTQTQAKSHCHYKNFLVAKVDGKPVGTLCSYEPRISTKEAFVNALKEIAVVDVEEALDVIYSCRFDINKRTLMFDFMEELEGFMNVGVLNELMKKSLLNARLKGYTIAQTIIEIGSLESKLLYEKFGFKEIAQKECQFYREKFGRSGNEKSFEYMKREDAQYELGIVVEYNINATKGRGSCIFMHVQKSENTATAGCTSMSFINLQKIATWLDKSKNPILIQITKKQTQEVRMRYPQLRSSKLLLD